MTSEHPLSAPSLPEESAVSQSVAELARIKSDPVFRALFFARLDASLEDRFATDAAVVEEIEAAAHRLRSLIMHSGGERVT